MLTKSMIAIAAIAVAVTALPAGNAEAKSNVDINIGIGLGGYIGPGYGYGGYGYYRPAYDDHYGMSCSGARKVVKWHGFHKIRSLDCSAPTYRFSGWKGGNRYKIKVSSSGEILHTKGY